MTASLASSVAQTWRVLVIDDSPDDRAEVRRLLLKGSERRYALTEAETGAAALRAVLNTDERPDCVVLDYNLPDMDAVEVLSALSGHDGLTICPVVVLTGSVGYEYSRAVLKAGAQDYLGKGWMTPESLTRAVENATERWAMAREMQDQGAALSQTNQQLQMALSERLRTEDELRRLAAELSEADRRKDVFLATLAHELRGPLSPIRNGLQLMKLTRNNGEELEQVRAMIERQLLQLVRLVDDLLDVSRITQEKMELRKERVDLRAVIDAAVETSRPALEQAGHELSVVLPDEPVFVDGDPARLAQVVSNLLNNSAKYTHRGGHVRLMAGIDDGLALVSVKDDGIGIPAGMIGRVFEMFTQVDRKLEKTTGGLGIGLSLVKGLMQMHGGTIEAHSDGEGMGSEFVVRLPTMMDAVHKPKPASRQTSEVVPSALRRILVVDDNADAAESLGQLLEVLGNEVRVANDGEAGVAAAAQFRPEVVLMDIGMPKLNGYDAAQHIRQQSWGKGILLVALTGWGQEEDQKKSADAGFNHHLVKPVELDALTKLLSNWRIN